MIEGMSQLLGNLDRMSRESRDVAVTVDVSYSAPYALRVHEDLYAPHPDGQAKFLEQPVRQYEAELSRLVSSLVRGGVAPERAIERAAELLLELSLPLVPVDTGRLRRSGKVTVKPTRGQS